METPKCIAHSMCGPTSSDLRDGIHSFSATEQERSCAFEELYTKPENQWHRNICRRGEGDKSSICGSEAAPTTRAKLVLLFFFFKYS